MQGHQLRIGLTVYLRLSCCPDYYNPDDTPGQVIDIERRNFNLYRFAKVKWANGKIQWLAVSQLRLTPPSLGTFHIKAKSKE